MPSHSPTEHSVAVMPLTWPITRQSTVKPPVQPVYDAVMQNGNPYFEGKPFDVAEENLQARIRALYLMAFCNKHHFILLNTSNKSEMAVGYGTLYGDMCGGMAVLGDVYKTEVYELVKYQPREGTYSPKYHLQAPSAELATGAERFRSTPDYALLDRILFQYIELRKDPGEIVEKGFDQALVNRIQKW
ncbi:MAG: NAD(+) synthase [Chitinophagaceae bacterium]|nr:NAD(+) synthase [Chitinophagaceae bacterium]